MTRQEYIDGQEASGIEVGDTVRVVRKAESYEAGWRHAWFGAMDDIAEFIVLEINSDGGMLHKTDQGMNWYYPYFVLEITKKADGTVPSKTLAEVEELTENIYSGDSNMKTQEIYEYVVTESIKVKDDNGQVESTKKKILGKGGLPAFDVDNAKIKAMAATTIPDSVDIDEVEVLVRPFCG